MNDLIRKARDAIGETTGDDWRIDPTAHADALEGKARQFAEHLSQHQAIIDTAMQYKDQDDRACQAQGGFKGTARRANIAIFLTASLAAAVTVAGIMLGSTAPQEAPATIGTGGTGLVFVCLGIAGLVASSLASMWLGLLRHGTRLQSWMEARAKAEGRRLEYFDIVRTTSPRSDTYVELLKLEYFRRYLLGSQIEFFTKRGADHEALSNKTLKVSTAATAFAAILTGAAGVLAAAIGEGYAALGGLGVMATAFGAMYSAREGLNQDRRNAHRYRVTKDTLVDIRKRFLDHVRQDILDGRHQSHEDFVDSVRAILLDEHAQWLDTARIQSAAVDRLERRLHAATDKDVSKSAH